MAQALALWQAEWCEQQRSLSIVAGASLYELQGRAMRALEGLQCNSQIAQRNSELWEAAAHFYHHHQLCRYLAWWKASPRSPTQATRHGQRPMLTTQQALRLWRALAKLGLPSPKVSPDRKGRQGHQSGSPCQNGTRDTRPQLDQNIYAQWAELSHRTRVKHAQRRRAQRLYDLVQATRGDEAERGDGGDRREEGHTKESKGVRSNCHVPKALWEGVAGVTAGPYSCGGSGRQAVPPAGAILPSLSHSPHPSPYARAQAPGERVVSSPGTLHWADLRSQPSPSPPPGSSPRHTGSPQALPSPDNGQGQHGALQQDAQKAPERDPEAKVSLSLPSPPTLSFSYSPSNSTVINDNMIDP